MMVGDFKIMCDPGWYDFPLQKGIDEKGKTVIGINLMEW